MTTDVLTATDVLRAGALTIESAAGPIVHGAGLRLGQGRSLGIIGESGSGKTMTLRSLMGLLPDGVRLAGGRIEIALGAGPSRVVQDPAELRGRGVSMVFQDPLSALDPTMRVGAFVAGVVAHHDHVSRRRARATVHGLLAEVGFADPARIAASFPHQLSNGQRQRIVLAIALATHPEVLLCDEATSALDVTTQAQIVDLLNELRVRRGLSVVFVTHDLAVARSAVDDVVVMFAGRVVEVGDIDTVLERPRHPYTRALIDAYSTGAQDAGSGNLARALPVTDPGCPYRRRCAAATADCVAPIERLDPLAIRVGSSCVRDRDEPQVWGAA
ncbi:ABC transporter ATP-binding protein [Intrasporangium sp.]|uniref:ABC transporter ATP-binding protein n=1 Tax=Intrasporangium sp. TaxID=1925024 RepID=UPI00293A1FD8|nr:ABC transporter ATP-binding protein [Intrasporangium sp.]MDV3219888.1 ABC transporter ATP-binding protein [Intrasporangium sp.]